MQNLIQIGFFPDLLKGKLPAPVLDHLRWIAAFLVCVGHLRNLIFPDASKFGQMGSFTAAFYFFTLFATESVTVFFVISGLLVGGKVLVGFMNKNFSLLHYALDRLIRLYLVLVPAILLTIALSRAGLSRCQIDATDLVGNLLFLQNVAVAPICNDHPLWSLSNEMFYYILCPLIFLVFLGPRRWLSGCFLFLTLAMLAAVVRPDRQDILLSAGLWVLGLVPWVLRVRLPFYIFGTSFLVALVAARTHAIHSPYISDYSIALTLALTLSSEFRVQLPSGAWAASFSYSLYLVHMPLAIAASVMFSTRDVAMDERYIFFLSTLAVIILVAWLFGLLFESRTQQVRRLIFHYVENGGSS